MKQKFEDLIKFISEKKLWGLVITCLLIGLFSLGYYVEYNRPEIKVFQRFEYPLIDLRHRLLFDLDAADDDILIITITENSLKRYQDVFGGWPWPRNVWAEVVKFLRKADSVLLDIGFIEPSGSEVYPDEARRVNQVLQAALQNQDKNPAVSQRYFKILRQWINEYSKSPDVYFGRSLQKYGPVITATWFSEIKGGKLPAEKLAKFKQIMSRFGYGLRGDPGPVPFNSYVTPPVDPVVSGSYGLAHISFTPDPDGPARRFSPFIGLKSPFWSNYRPDKPLLPILGLAGALAAENLPPGESSIKVSDSYIEIGEQQVPLDREGKVLIRYKGGISPENSPYSTYNVIPIEKIIEQLLDDSSSEGPSPDFFAGKKILVGSTATGAHDLRATPFSAQEAGVAIHANILDMFLNNDFLKPIQLWDTILLIVIWTLAVGTVATFLSPVIALIITVLLSLLLVVMGFGLFDQGYVINLSAPLLSLYTTYGLTTMYNLVFERQKRRQVRQTFQQYLTASVMEEVLKDPDKLELGGERREISVLFADIAGFTTFSEGRTATEVARVINKILTEMTECIFRYEGVLDKYIGDEMVAEFGIIPVEPPEHAARAVKAAIDMRTRMKELREQWRQEGHPLLQLRIGVHTGEAATGNMGSEALFDYTALGDNVNLGSRLEGANKQYDTLSMISEDTYRYVKDLAVVRELDKIIVKGKDEPVTVYELIGRQGRVEAGELDLVERFEEGLKLYRQQRWEEAIDIFESILSDFPEDGPSKVFRDRAREFIKEPPPEDWDGVYRLTTK